MKINCCIIALCFALFCRLAFAHDVSVHRQITAHAAASALANSLPFTNFLAATSLDIDYKTSVVSMVEGSAREDDADQDSGGKRSYNHFYDPLTGLGMSDFPPDLRLMMGTNSFAWASLSNSPGLDFIPKNLASLLKSKIENINTSNTWSWQNARGYELLGLSGDNQAVRTVALTNMFRALGQVIHLLEDTSQPQHTRNEQHLDVSIPVIGTPWISPIETYGKTNFLILNYGDGSMLDWHGAGFTKLEDFWNRHLYNGSSSAELIADTNGGTSTLGLAEFSNGNFLGARHLFPEYFTPGDIQYYPFPSRDHSTNYKDVKDNPSIGLKTYSLDNNHEAKGIFIKKTDDGVVIQHISRINYLGAKIPGLAGRPYCTISSPPVLKDYHDILIPKAVQYSAGLLDYYFRGQLDTCVRLGVSTGNLAVRVTNKSGTNFVGGAFTILSEDSSGTRATIATESLSTNLSDEDSISIDFPPPTNAVAYVVVYQGTIGATNGAPLDPVDSGIAVAAQRFTVEQDTDEEITYDKFFNGIPVDEGTITAVAEGSALGDMPAGNYAAAYIGGHASGFSPSVCGVTSGDCANCTAQLYFTGTSWQPYFGNGTFQAQIRCPVLPCIFDNSPSNASSSGVEANTSTNIFFICHPGGPFGPTVSPRGVCGDTTLDEGGTFDPGNITYSVTYFVYPQLTNSLPANLTVDLTSDVLNKLLACPGDETNSVLPTWDGKLAFVESNLCTGYVEWNTDDPITGFSGVAINGFEVSASLYTAYDLPTVEGVGWRLVISVHDPDDGLDLVWSGCKSKGYAPGGTYLFDQRRDGCASNLCSITVE